MNTIHYHVSVMLAGSLIASFLGNAIHIIAKCSIGLESVACYFKWHGVSWIKKTNVTHYQYENSKDECGHVKKGKQSWWSELRWLFQKKSWFLQSTSRQVSKLIRSPLQRSLVRLQITNREQTEMETNTHTRTFISSLARPLDISAAI